MTRYYKATFTNGITRYRSTTSKHYTHAWYATTYNGYHQGGFSTSALQAARNMATETRYSRNDAPNQFEEVQPVVEIPRQQYVDKGTTFVSIGDAATGVVAKLK